MKKSKEDLDIVGNKEFLTSKQLDLGEFNDFVPMENFEIELNMIEADILADFEKRMLVVVSQPTNLTVKDLRIYRIYTAVISDMFKKGVDMVIVCTADPPENELILDDSDTISFNPIVRYTKKISGDDVLNSIDYKIENNQMLTDEELVKLTMLATFKLEDDEFLEKISKSLELTGNLKNVPNGTDELQITQLRFIDEVGTDEQKQEIFKMTKEVLRDNYFIKEFVKEAKIDIALNMIHKKDISVEEAAEIAELPLYLLKNAISD